MGRIVVVGYTTAPGSGGTPTNLALLRLNANGTQTGGERTLSLEQYCVVTRYEERQDRKSTRLNSSH